MKLKFIFIFCLVSLQFFSQPFFEDFSFTPTGGLANAWWQFNVDGNHVSPQISNYGIENKGWACVNLSSKSPEHGRVMCSTSWYSPIGTSNDWLVSPSFAVSANSILTWDAMSGDGINADGYEVRVSQGGNQPTDFTNTLAIINAESGNWKTRHLSLNTYSNQIIRIAFVNKSYDKYLLFLDNVEVKVPLAVDAGVLNINSHSKYFNGVYQTFFKPFCGTIKNYGSSPISTANIGFQVKNDTIVYENFQFSPPINYSETRAFCFNYFPSTFTDTTNNRIKAWAFSANNVVEINHYNDTAKCDINLPEYNSVSIPKNDLIEMFGSSNSEACAELFSNFDSILIKKKVNTNSNLNVIKYQIEKPPELIDPSSNKHSISRTNFYNINYVPSAIINGTYNVLNFDDATLSYFAGGASYFHMTFAYPQIENNIITTTLNLTSLFNLRNESSVRVFLSLNQKHYTNKNNTSTQKEFYNVIRTMIPNEHGIVVALTSGHNTLIPVSYTINLNESPQVNSEDFWDENIVVFELIAFVQDTVSKEILQSISLPLKGKALNVTNLFDADSNHYIYPNPANKYFYFADTHNTLSFVEIFDLNGKLIFKKEIKPEEKIILTDNFPEGVYLIKISNSSSSFYDKLIISH